MLVHVVGMRMPVFESQLFDATLQLFNGFIDVWCRQDGSAHEATGVFPDELGHGVVGLPGEIHALLFGQFLQCGRTGHHTDVNAATVHLRHALRSEIHHFVYEGIGVRHTTEMGIDFIPYFQHFCFRVIPHGFISRGEIVHQLRQIVMKFAINDFHVGI